MQKSCCSLLLQPASGLQFAAQGTDITGQVTTALNTRVPSVGIVPPAEWRPARESASIFQEIQQTLLAAQLQQARQNAAQQQQSTTQAPVGR